MAEADGVVVRILLLQHDVSLRFLMPVADYAAFASDVHGDQVALPRVLQSRVDQNPL